MGVRIVRDALQIPAKTIITNGGGNGDVIIGRLLEDAKGNVKCNYGYDIATGKYGDMIKVCSPGVLYDGVPSCHANYVDGRHRSNKGGANRFGEQFWCRLTSHHD